MGITLWGQRFTATKHSSRSSAWLYDCMRQHWRTTACRARKTLPNICATRGMDAPITPSATSNFCNINCLWAGRRSLFIFIAFNCTQSWWVFINNFFSHILSLLFGVQCAEIVIFSVVVVVVVHGNGPRSVEGKNYWKIWMGDCMTWDIFARNLWPI